MTTSARDCTSPFVIPEGNLCLLLQWPLPVFARHPERSDCAVAIAQPKDLQPSRQPHSRLGHSTRTATTLVPRGFSLGFHTTPGKKGALAPEARP